MKNKIILCLTLIFITCLFCLPLAIKTETAYASDAFDVSGYVIRDSKDTKSPLYSNGKDGTSSPRSKKLTIEDIVGAVDAPTKEFKTEFPGNRVYMLPVASSQESTNVVVKYLTGAELGEGGIAKISIEARKASASAIVIYVAIGDIGSSDKPEIYVINVEVISNLPSGLAESINFWNSNGKYFPLKVGEQRKIGIDDIIKEINSIENGGGDPSFTGTDFIDSTNIQFDTVQVDSKDSEYISVKRFSTLFTIVGERETPVTAAPYHGITITLKDKDAKTLQFRMQVSVSAASDIPTIEINSTSLEITTTYLVSAEALAQSPAGKALTFDANTAGTKHALRGNDYIIEYDEIDGTQTFAVINDICEVRVQRDIQDERRNKLEIVPIKNGFTTIVVYVADFDKPTIETKIFLSVTVRDIYNLENIYIDSLRKASFSIHNNEIFGDLEKDGFSLVSINRSMASSDILVASVESGTLILNPKGAGEVDIELNFSDGIRTIALSVTVVIHKFDLFKDLSMLEIVGIFAGLALLLFLIVLFIVRRIRKRKKAAVENVESKVVIGRRDAYTGAVINPALLKVQQEQNKRPAYVASTTSTTYNNPYMLPPTPQVQGNLMALNAAQPMPQPAVIQHTVQQTTPVQQPVYMALTQGKGNTIPDVQQPQTDMNTPPVMNIYVTEAPKEEPQTPNMENVYTIEEQPPMAQPPMGQPYMVQTEEIFIPQEQQPQTPPADQPIILGQQTVVEQTSVTEPQPQPVFAQPTFDTIIMTAQEFEKPDPTDDEILEKAFKEHFQSTMKYRQFRKDKALHSQILNVERERIRVAREAYAAQMKNQAPQTDAAQNTEPKKAEDVSVAAKKASATVETQQAEFVAEEPSTPANEILVDTQWVANANMEELIDKKLDLDESLMRTTHALKEIEEEKTKLSTAATEATAKYKKLEAEIEELKIKLAATPDPEKAAPIYEKLNSVEGEYNSIKETMPDFVAKVKQRREEIDAAEEEYKKRKASIELGKMDLEDRIQEIKAQQVVEQPAPAPAPEEVFEEVFVEEAPASEEFVQVEEVSEEAVSQLSEIMVSTLSERKQQELMREDAKLKKEFEEEEVKVLSDKLGKTANPAEQEVLMSDISKKKAEIEQIVEQLKEYDNQIAHKAVELAEQEAKFAQLTQQIGTAQKLKEYEEVKAKKEAEYKEEKERIIANRMTIEDKKHKEEELDALTELVLKTVTDRNRTELKSDNVIFRREMAEKDIVELESRLAATDSHAAQATIKAEIAEKREDIADYNKKLREYDDYISEYDEKMKQYYDQISAIAQKYGMENQIHEFNMARVQQDFDHKVEKERIRSEKAIESERIEAERKLERERSEAEKKLEQERLEAERKLEKERLEGAARFTAAVDERAMMAERKLAEERAENERRLKELEEKAKLGSLEERLAYKKQQLAFVAEDVPRMRDPEHGQEMLQKVEKIEKDLVQDERNSDIIFEIGRVRDSIHNNIELCKLRAEIRKPVAQVVTAPVVQQPVVPVQQPAPVAASTPTRTVVKKVTNNVRKVSSQQGPRQPQVIRVQGSRPSNAPARMGQQRPGTARMSGGMRQGQRPVRPGTGARPPMSGRAARPGVRPASRAGQRTVRSSSATTRSSIRRP